MHPAFILGCLAVVAGMVRLAVYWQLPLPFCVLRKTTGIPCPGCGCTRSLLAWAQLDPLAALRYNPLFFAATIAVLIWAIHRWSSRARRTTAAIGAPDWADGSASAGPSDGWPRCLRLFRSPSVLLALAGLNWLYLCLTLPK